MSPEDGPKLILMPFRPKSLAYQLRALYDAGVATPADIARSCGVDRARVDGWLRGKVPDRVTEIQVRKVISYHARRSRRDYLKLETDEDIAVVECPAEGIFEEMDAPPGQIEFKVRDGLGKRMGLLQFRSDTIDDELMGDLERWHTRKNPTHLKLESSETPS